MSTVKLLLPDVPAHREILPYLQSIDEARWYTNFGPLALRFEAELAKLLGVPASSLCSVSNCTVGLELALAGLKLAPGSRVLLPSFTFIATAAAVVRAGLVPLLADIDPKNWTLTPGIAEDALRAEKFACVLPVAALGCALPAAEWDEFSRRTGIPVLIDAAGAFGNQAIGAESTTVFSFHATKTFGIGEGGLVASNAPGLAAKVRRLSNFGIDPATGEAIGGGSNGKLSEYHAAVGLAALAAWPEKVRRRQELHRLYRDTLREHCPLAGLQDRAPDGVYSVLQVQLPPGADNVRIAAALAAKGIETRRWYLPLLKEHPAFAHCPVSGTLSVARSLSARLLGLPFHLQLDGATIRNIAQALALVLREDGHS